jgi:Mn2+/Fe2+ NRAMP family transporter
MLSQPSGHDAVYRWSAALLGLSPLYVVFLGVEPVALTLVVRSMVVIVIPVLVVSLMKIANDRTLMGDHRLGAFSNAVLSLLVVVSIYLTVRVSGEWWRMLTR